MRRRPQLRDTRAGERHSLAEGLRMSALEALLPDDLEKHCQLQRSRLDTYDKLREEVISRAEARGYVAPRVGQVGKPREGPRRGRRGRRARGGFSPSPAQLWASSCSSWTAML